MGYPWLLHIERDALLVQPGLSSRLRKRNPTAMRQLAELQPDLTELYRARYTKLKFRQLPGLFWSDMPEHERIPVVRGGRNPPPEWVKTKVEGKKVTHPNPKFELVVVNKHDRDALLKLLGEADPAANVAGWLKDRTKQDGATTSGVLHADYEGWCRRRGEAATGSKSFAQALVAAGVVKLKRGKDGERYALELRRA